MRLLLLLAVLALALSQGVGVLAVHDHTEGSQPHAHVLTVDGTDARTAGSAAGPTERTERSVASSRGHRLSDVIMTVVLLLLAVVIAAPAAWDGRHRRGVRGRRMGPRLLVALLAINRV